jgi:hypothetical protein
VVVNLAYISVRYWSGRLVMVGWGTSQNCGLYRPIVHPRVIAIWTMVWWYRLRLTPNSSTRALWQPPVLSGCPISRDISRASRRMGEGNENLVYASPWDFKRSLTCRKILQRGTCGFTSHPKEVVMRIFIALINPSLWPGSNPRPLGPVASTLTTRPPRRLRYWSWVITTYTKRRNFVRRHIQRKLWKYRNCPRCVTFVCAEHWECRLAQQYTRL